MNNAKKEIKDVCDVDKCREMQNALIAITNEITRLNNLSAPQDILNITEYNECIFKKLVNYRRKLISKKEMILKLREVIRVAYFVANIFMAAKINKIAILHINLKTAQTKNDGLREICTEQSKMASYLAKENKTVREEIENLKNFVDIGYRQLQKSRNQTPECHLPSIVKLRIILVDCHHNNANYSNLHQKYEQILRRNRFLANKINIISQNLIVATSEVFNLRAQVLRLKRENSYLKQKGIPEVEKITNVCFVTNNKTSNIKTNKSDTAKLGGDTNICYVDLGSHLSLVKKLLNDQDLILKELTCLSQSNLFLM